VEGKTRRKRTFDSEEEKFAVAYGRTKPSDLEREHLAGRASNESINICTGPPSGKVSTSIGVGCRSAAGRRPSMDEPKRY
jgi:hypothetical protein